jgi:hypothetical protein
MKFQPKRRHPLFRRRSDLHVPVFKMPEDLFDDFLILYIAP